MDVQVFGQILNRHTMLGEKTTKGAERVIEHVLVIDGLEQAAVDEVKQIRSLDDRHAVVVQQNCNAFDKVVNFWDVCKDIVRVNRSRFDAGSAHLGGKRGVKYSTRVSTPVSWATRATFAAGSIPRTRIPASR